MLDMISWNMSCLLKELLELKLACKRIQKQLQERVSQFPFLYTLSQKIKAITKFKGQRGMLCGINFMWYSPRNDILRHKMHAVFREMRKA